MSSKFLVLVPWITAISLLGVRAEAGDGDAQSRIRSGHNLLQDSQTSDLIPGSFVPELRFRDVSGKSHYLSETLEKGPAVFVFLSTQCPLAKRYTQRLIRLHESYAKQGVSLFAVFPNTDETLQGIRDYMKQTQLPLPAVRDATGYLVDALAASMTPQVFVIDGNSILRYRGAIDDNRYEPRVKEHYLTDALDAVLEGTEVTLTSVDALGCTIHQEVADASGGAITYSSHIARILQDNCQSCHRPGQVAPFSLTNYEEAVRWQTELKEYTHARLMPPWKAAPGVADYKNDISLSEQEIQLIAKWVDDGTPRGDEADMPPAPRFPAEWALGDPDQIYEMPEEYVVGPEGEDDYRHFIIPHRASEHRFVEALDVIPGNHNVVHHVIAYVDTSGKARELDAADPGPGYTRFGGVGFEPASVIGGWAPGNLPVKTPAGTGFWLPKECDIVLQVHYYRTGVEERDRTKIGIYYSKSRQPVPVRGNMAINTKFVLKADDSHCVVRAKKTIEEPSYLFSVTPHMHLIGKTMEVVAVRPDGTEIPMVRIDDWDFNWQTTYRFAELHYLPAGTEVRLVATFDNSSSNPNNPNSPTKDVTWGEKTTDEMCIAFFDLLHASEYDPEAQGRRIKTAAADGE